jgi:hypothetical protein
VVIADDEAAIAAAVADGTDAITVPEALVADPPPGATVEKSLLLRLQEMTVAERIKLALRGNREVRMVLIRDSNRLIRGSGPRATRSERPTRCIIAGALKRRVRRPEPAGPRRPHACQEHVGDGLHAASASSPRRRPQGDRRCPAVVDANTSTTVAATFAGHRHALDDRARERRMAASRFTPTTRPTRARGRTLARRDEARDGGRVRAAGTASTSRECRRRRAGAGEDAKPTTRRAHGAARRRRRSTAAHLHAEVEAG